MVTKGRRRSRWPKSPKKRTTPALVHPGGKNGLRQGDRRGPGLRPGRPAGTERLRREPAGVPTAGPARRGAQPYRLYIMYWRTNNISRVWFGATRKVEKPTRPSPDEKLAKRGESTTVYSSVPTR
jgi:hypothetical protein